MKFKNYCYLLSTKIWTICLCMIFIMHSNNVFSINNTNTNQSVQSSADFVVKGKVVDKSGAPIIGAFVIEKGTSNGVSTDEKGEFSILLKSGQAVVVCKCIGYLDKEVTVLNASVIDITMEDDAENLQEIVVIGYGTQKKVDVTSAVSSVKQSDFNAGAVQDAGQLIQGKVAGLQISLTTGDPNASTSVMLRGNSSLKGGTAPLILVDGIPGSFETVAPEDIQSIDVLKDGSATAIYGTRGTNGVIIISTKSGKRETPASINYSGYLYVAQQYKTPDFLTAEDLRAKMAEGYSPSGANDKDYGATTDWLGEISRTSISHVHNLTFSAGGKQTSIIANLTFNSRQGTFKNTGVNNMRGRIEATHKMFNNKLTTNISLIAGERNSDSNFSSIVYRHACIQNPTQPVYDEKGNYVERPVYFYNNPVSEINETERMSRSRNLRFVGSMEYKPIESIALKAMYSRRSNSYLSGYYETLKHPSTTENGRNGYASRSANDNINNLVELTADWKQQFGKHFVGAIIGYNYEDNTYETFSASNSDFPTDSYTYNKLEAGGALKDGTAGMNSYKDSYRLIGLFARVTYNYDERYLLMASIRREGSSKFGADHKWGNFPGVSAGWRINNESFLKDVNWINNLKLRFGFGITGININDPYVSLASLNYSGYFFYNNEWVNALIPVRNPNPDLQWEKKYEYNLGLDFDLFGGRLGGSVDVYRRDTKDALWDYSVPVPPYIYGNITANVGEIRNQGVEVAINAIPVQTKNFEWNTNVSYSTNKNQLVSISNDQFQMSQDWFTTGHTGEPIQTTTHRVKVGDPLGNFFGLRSVGIDENGKWVVERLKKDDKGNVTEIFYDLAANATPEDRQVLGNGVPKHFLNWNNHFRLKGFDLTLNMRGAFDFQILNFQEMYYSESSIQYNVLNSAFNKYNAIKISDDQKSYSSTGKQVMKNDSQRYVSEFVENGSYWKIDNITLGYTLNFKKVKWIKQFRVYASCMNLFTFTNYKGLDPEIGMTGLTPGTDDRDKYPTIRTYTLGLNLTF